MIFWRKIFFSGCLLFATICLAESKTEKSSKSIDFDGATVEGVSKQPLDSLNELHDKDNSKDRVHLYQKRRAFTEENREIAHDLTETY